MGLQLSPDVLALNPELAKVAKGGRVAGSPRIAKADMAPDPYKSKLERFFAIELADIVFMPGEWKYEPITLHVAGGLYTPDFFGPLANGRGLAAVEVKGWGKSIDRSKLKFRAAVEQHKWLSFCWLQRDRAGEWAETWYMRERA